MRLYGKRSVTERLHKNPRSIKKIYIQDGMNRPDIAHLGRSKNVSVEVIKPQRFNQLVQGGVHTQGVIAEIENFRYEDLDEILEREDKPVVLFLDRINDPQNLGSILRSCACFGGFCVVVPKFESVEVTEAVLKVACGGENYVPVCRVVNLSVAVQKAKKEGYWIGAAVVEGGQNPRQLKLNFPFGLVVGSEGRGVRPGLVKDLDYRFTLPMQGAELSFNVAVAVSIFCYEIVNQRQ
ncbi:MAG: 23S rRNA (guanosine(2251)-2'-O)-methyltransferase RlmB [Candidatus Omnitrophica bacterium]|nr:23S rRNA (guanosine(2251)-2'-O)-methyltransferase RlmB [Candidatus Omnitrophota bacterium]